MSLTGCFLIHLMLCAIVYHVRHVTCALALVMCVMCDVCAGRLATLNSGRIAAFPEKRCKITAKFCQ